MPSSQGAILLGEHPGAMRPRSEPSADSRAKFEELTDKERETLAKLAETHGEKAATTEPVDALFLVIIPRGGVAIAIPDIAQAASYDGPPATVEQMGEACRVVARDIDQGRQAHIVVNTQMQMAAAVQRQAEDVAMRQKLGI